MYLSILTLPLLGSLVSGFLGRKLGAKGSQIITTTCVVITTLLAIVIFFEVSLNHIPVSINLFRWIDSESLHVSWGFNFDSLTVSMLIPVLIVSSLVHLYSIGYMSNDPHNPRFFSYLSLFTFMMIILVTGNNYLLMFVGWEGVGVCSYLLVSFWFTRIAANQSSLAAFLTNRVGDCFLTIGMFVLLLTFGNINYSLIFSLSPYISEDIITLIGILLLLGAMAKSSQIGLHVWLPMAMEGPTPVSALIHAATMVTAGVYLLMRSSPLIEYSSTVLLSCLWIGAITTVFSSLIGLFQQDIKKVIAYSTMSQLGMMVIAVGLSSYNLALFHLVNHAFYKALLFLGAGSVIHAVADNQDFRKYGGLKAFLPLTYSVMLIASLSLVAFPFMTGFYSKDFILESAYGNFSFSTSSVYFIALIGAMFTTLYSVKVLYLTFLTNPNGPQSSYKIAHEGDIYMSLPLILLAVFSIVFGYVTKDLFIGLGSDIFSDNSLFIHPNHEITLDTEFAVPVFFKLLPLAFTICLSLIYISFSEFIAKNAIVSFKFTRFGYNLYSFFNQRFLIEAFYNKFITDAVLNVGGQTTKVIDKGSVELLGPFGLEKGLSLISNFLAKFDTKVVTSYALYITVFLMVYLTFSLFYSDSLFFMLLLPVFCSKNMTKRAQYNFCSTDLFIKQFSVSSLVLRRAPDRPTPYTDGNESEFDYWVNPALTESESDSEDDTDTFDPHNGRTHDSCAAISSNCRTREELVTYFDTKEQSFIAAFNDDVAGVRRDPNPNYDVEAEVFLVRREHNLSMEELRGQREDLLDPAFFSPPAEPAVPESREENNTDDTREENNTHNASEETSTYNTTEESNTYNTTEETSTYNTTEENNTHNTTEERLNSEQENTRISDNDPNVTIPDRNLPDSETTGFNNNPVVSEEPSASSVNETLESKELKTVDSKADVSKDNLNKSESLKESEKSLGNTKRKRSEDSEEPLVNVSKRKRSDDSEELSVNTSKRPRIEEPFVSKRKRSDDSEEPEASSSKKVKTAQDIDLEVNSLNDTTIEKASDDKIDTNLESTNDTDKKSSNNGPNSGSKGSGSEGNGSEGNGGTASGAGGSSSNSSNNSGTSSSGNDSSNSKTVRVDFNDEITNVFKCEMGVIKSLKSSLIDKLFVNLLDLIDELFSHYL